MRNPKTDARWQYARRIPLCAAWLCVAGLLAGCGHSADPPADPNLVTEIRNKAASSGGADAVTAVADGWGTLRGKFVFQGDPPPARPKTVDKDVSFCGKHTIVFEDVVLGPGNGLANVVVYIKRPPAQIHPDFTDGEGAEVVLDNKNCRFEPHVSLLTTKDKFVVLNSDPVGHNTNYTGRGGFSESIAPGGKLVKSFSKRGDVPAATRCDVHPWMDAWVLVLDHPYSAKSADDGSFEIKNLPAGIDLEFQVWHERAKKVTAAGQVPIKSGRFKVKIPKDGALDLGALVVQAGDVLK